MKNITIFFAALFLSGCYPTTKITGSWKIPEISRTYHNVFVAALTGNTIAKSTIENELSTALNNKGIKTMKSMEEIPPTYGNDSISRSQLLERVQQSGSDAILTISLLKKETESRYVSGNYAPVSRWDYYNSFGGYYNHWYPYAYSPGYYQKDNVYYLETNLYDTKKEVLLWSAQSRTYSYESLQALSKEYAAVVVDQMIREKVIM